MRREIKNAIWVGIVLLGAVVHLTGKPAVVAPSVAETTEKPLSLEEASRKFLQCVMPEAQHGRYSSYDGGKSIEKILTKCGSQELAVTDACVADGSIRKDCWLANIVITQRILRDFGK